MSGSYKLISINGFEKFAPMMGKERVNSLEKKLNSKFED
jgi:hypothetical protein